jgi:hypothetical protein
VGGREVKVLEEAKYGGGTEDGLRDEAIREVSMEMRGKGRGKRQGRRKKRKKRTLSQYCNPKETRRIGMRIMSSFLTTLRSSCDRSLSVC